LGAPVAMMTKLTKNRRRPKHLTGVSPHFAAD
jgi:hypothetical protein